MPTRKALVVGIDFYQGMSPLYGCVNDALSVKGVLERHGDEDGNLNFDVASLSATGPANAIPRAVLKQTVRDLFDADGDCALFYFAGHGHIESTGGYILASDSSTGDDGLPLSELITLANGSRARNRIIILDSCHAGIAGAATPGDTVSAITEGLTILTASTQDQYATEMNGRGVFTGLLVDALSGAAANLIGHITPGSVYAHIDQSLGSWEQRPVFKTNVKEFVSLRRVQPPIGIRDLRRITEFFPRPGYEFALDPSFEPESGSPDPANTEQFAVLQRYNRINLLVPVGAPHMYFAAMERRSCRLTTLGEHYRRLVERGRI